MVKLIADGSESYNLVDTFLGFPSFFFQLGGTVVDATSTSFTLKAGGIAIPGFPIIEDPSPDYYTGVNLTYEIISFFGNSILTPKTGTITGVTETATNFQTTITEANVDAADWFRVSQTEDDADNFQLLKDVFSGADLIKGTAVGDKLSGYGGDDVVKGRGGSDKLWGAGGNDRVVGGSGSDTLNGGKGRDVQIGGSGSDVLIGGKGRDIQKGGAGADTFVFKGKNSGRDKIKDFKEDIDILKIKVSTVNSIADLDITYNGDDAIIRFEKTVIKVLDVGANALEANDFIF